MLTALTAVACIECWNAPYEAGFYCKRLVKKSAKGSNKKIMFGGYLLNVSKCF